MPLGFPGGASGEEPACQYWLDIRDVGSIPGSGISPGEGNDSLLQRSCLENPVEREAWQAVVHGVTKCQT